jgi:hypothetical protein
MFRKLGLSPFSGKDRVCRHFQAEELGGMQSVMSDLKS